MDGSPPARQADARLSESGVDGADCNERAYRLVLLAPLLWPDVVDWAPPRDRVAPDYWHRELLREVTTLFQPDCLGWTLKDKIALVGATRQPTVETLADEATRQGLPTTCLLAWQQAFETLRQCCGTAGLNLGALQAQLSGLQSSETD